MRPGFQRPWGDPELSRHHFEQAINYSENRDLMVKVEYARSYARLYIQQSASRPFTTGGSGSGSAGTGPHIEQHSGTATGKVLAEGRLLLMLRLLLIVTALSLGNAGACRHAEDCHLLPDGTSWMKAMRGCRREINEQTQGRVKLHSIPAV